MGPDDVRLILQLRLLIARAANLDSLGWWDDETFSKPAGFILDRVFPVLPMLAARSLALHAALRRHQAIESNGRGWLHLYRLDADNQDGLAIRFWPLQNLPVPEAPITSLHELRQHLLRLTGKSYPYTTGGTTRNGGLQIEPSPCPAGIEPIVHRACTLAWAYLEGTPGRTVIPCCLE